MKKEYQKPEIELISLRIPERIATNIEMDGDVDGELGLESSIFN